MSERLHKELFIFKFRGGYASQKKIKEYKKRKDIWNLTGYAVQTNTQFSEKYVGHMWLIIWINFFIFFTYNIDKFMHTVYIVQEFVFGYSGDEWTKNGLIELDLYNFYFCKRRYF